MADKKQLSFGDTKLRNLPQRFPSLMKPGMGNRVALWYHRKFIKTNKANPFFHVFVGLSAFGLYMHTSKLFQQMMFFF